VYHAVLDVVTDDMYNVIISLQSMSRLAGYISSSEETKIRIIKQRGGME